MGKWLVQDSSARMVVSCPDKATQTPGLWGVIVAETEPGVDNCHDPSMRGWPTLGIPILINMPQTAPDRWEGKIYDPKGTRVTKGGGIYTASITLKKDVLEVRGCRTSFICGGEDWTRITTRTRHPCRPRQ